jgi:hypothetical protein
MKTFYIYNLPLTEKQNNIHISLEMDFMCYSSIIFSSLLTRLCYLTDQEKSIDQRIHSPGIT